jgi:hypothetical protein
MAVVKDNVGKLLELCGAADSFRYKDPRTGAELLQNGRYYLKLVGNARARGESHMERVRDLLSLILAQALQPTARQAYGDGGRDAVNRLLEKIWNKSDVEDWWQSKLALLRDALSPIGLKPEQEEIILESFAEYPLLFRETLAAESSRLSWLPVENLAEFGRILTLMYQENAHDYQD